MIHGALDHLDHVIDLRGVGARDEGGPAEINCFIGLTGMSIAPVGSVLDLKPMGDVAVIEMVAADEGEFGGQATNLDRSPLGALTRRLFAPDIMGGLTSPGPASGGRRSEVRGQRAA
jgi:hypothetical protein